MAELMTDSPKLVLKYQGLVVMEYAITQPEFTIGRKPDNDLVIDDVAVSGRHAKIVKIQAVHFIEDLQSTNGTFINNHKIDRKQLRNADVVTIGNHRLVFLEDVKNSAPDVPPTFEGSDQTVVLKTGTGSSRSKGGGKVAVVHVVSGRTDRPEYRLTKQLTMIGSQPDAVIRLTGFFAPKSAAMVSRRGDSYYVTVPGRTKKVLLNDMVVEGQADLKDGDLLEVAGVKMYFYLKDAT